LATTQVGAQGHGSKAAGRARAGRAASDRYIQAALAGEAKIIATAVPGQRRDALNASTFQLARRFVDRGLLDATALRAAMIEAALAAGLANQEPPPLSAAPSAQGGAGNEARSLCPAGMSVVKAVQVRR
jgi:hypothetical protein